jgi:outer membrane protein assembly factor BamB
MRSATTSVLAAVVSASCLGGVAVQEKPAAPPLAISWQTEIEISGLLHLAVGPRAVLLAGSESGLTARAVDDGHVLWQIPKATGIQPAVAGKLLAILSDDALEVLDQDTGQLVWSAPVEGGESPPTVHATGELFLVIRGSEIRAWRTDGAVAWRATLTSAPVTRVVAGPDSLVVGLQSAEVVALDPANGTVRSTVKLLAPPTALTIAGDQLFIPTADGLLYAYRLTRDLKRMWRYRAVAAIGDAVVGERFAYFALLDNSLRAFDRKGGSQRWSAPLDSRPIAGPVLLGENLLVPLAAGTLAQIPAGTGKRPPSTGKAPERTSVRMNAMAASQDGLYVIVTGSSGVTTLLAWRSGAKASGPEPRSAPPQRH